jgi:hypothetical protein
MINAGRKHLFSVTEIDTDTRWLFGIAKKHTGRPSKALKSRVIRNVRGYDGSHSK